MTNPPSVTAIRERTLVILAAVFSTVFLVFALGARDHTLLGSADESVWRFWSSHGSALHSVAKAITSVGVVSVLLPASLVTGAIAFAHSRSVSYSLAPFFAVQITSIIVSVMKDGMNTARPPMSSHIVAVDSAAFPSGHAANTTALLVATVVIWRVALSSERVQRHAPAIGFIGVVAMATTRLILNVHWLSDVVGGIALGTACALAVCAVSLRLHALLRSI